jgi:hypothetical protein
MAKTHSQDFFTRKAYQRHCKQTGKTIRIKATRVKRKKPDSLYGVKTRLKQLWGR